MSKPLTPPKLPKLETIYSKGNPTKGLNRTKAQIPKIGVKPQKTTTFKPEKFSLPKIKVQGTKVMRTTKAR